MPEMCNSQATINKSYIYHEQEYERLDERSTKCKWHQKYNKYVLKHNVLKESNRNGNNTTSMGHETKCTD